MTTLPQLRTIRLPTYDYARNGIYFVTMCSHGRKRVFGRVEDGQVVLSKIGRIVEEEWLRIPVMRPYIELESYIIMPSHLHGILVFQDPHGVRAKESSAIEKPTGWRRGPGSLGSVIAGVKAAVTRRVNQLLPGDRSPLWQRNYYEHIISSDAELDRVREYVDGNPMSWSQDVFKQVVLVSNEH